MRQHLLAVWVLFGWSGVATVLIPRAAGATPAAMVALSELRAGRLLEWRLEGVPAVTNPFDPAVIRVDVEVTEPDGRRRSIPAFWYRPYRRALVDGSEVLTATGEGEWRLRSLGAQEGSQAMRVRVSVRDEPALVLVETNFMFAAATAPFRGFARVAPERQFFETADRTPLPLVGADTCWHGRRGTYDYDDWFPAMAASGWNWGRLWMWPSSFGLETAPGERLNYRQDRAWQLDRVLDLAATHGLRMLLCLDYHGMFETEPDFWGGNNVWPRHPYNAANGGPCANQRAFFTDPTARQLYQARLRYLVARYGAHPGLFAWQFFNEIDNVYRHLNAAEVATWHNVMGEWLAAHDPWQRLRTTSLTGGSDRAEIWSVPSLDFAVYHSYAEPAPARRLAAVTQSMRGRYGKPVLVGEAGVDWRGWARQSDPFLRGFRQLLWGGVLAGSAGTSMSWWWESIHSENAYPSYRALTNVLAGVSWGRGNWEPVRVRENPPPPTGVGEVLSDGVPFGVQLTLDGSWGARPGGELAVPDAEAAGYAPQRLNGFVHGTAHAELRVPFQVEAWFGDAARLVLHLNSVSDGALLTVWVDGVRVLRRPLPNKDGKWEVNNEYNEDIPVALTPGRHRVEVRNAGGDWFCLDWVRLEGVRPARYADEWTPAPAVTALHRQGQVLAYLVAPGREYPAQATVTNPPAGGPYSLVLSNLPAGDYAALWFRTTDGTSVGRTTSRVGGDGLLRVATPAFAEDLVGHLFTPPALRAEALEADGGFRMRVEGVRGREFLLEGAESLGDWQVRVAESVEESGGMTLTDPVALPASRRFYRLRFPAP